MSKIAIIGSGSWGVALGTHLAKLGNEIKIWSFDKEEKRLINEERKCKFLPGLVIDPNITCSNELEEVIEDTDNINKIANWLNELLLDEVSFPENETPSDTEGGECYSFTVSDAEGKQINFHYYINGLENYYIWYNEKWYIVKNPVALTL